MSNIKDVRCKPRLGISWSMAAMMGDVVFRRWAHAPTIHAASHVDHEERVAWFSTSMLPRSSLKIVMVILLAALFVLQFIL